MMNPGKQMLAGMTFLAAIAAVAYAAAQTPSEPVHAHAEDDGHDHAAHAEAPDHAAHADDHDHAAHADGEAHDHGAAGHEEEGLRLTAEQRQRFGIAVRLAGPGHLRNEVSLPGEIVFNEDRVVHLTPRVSGIAREVLRTVGDRVKAGDVMAVLESRELADAQAEYLAARARAGLAGKVFDREKSLREQKVSSEQDLLDAELASAEAHIVLRAAEQKLRTLGLSESSVAGLEEVKDEAITRFELRAPLDGIVTAKHISLGESMETDTDVFTIADMTRVWVNLTVHTRHLAGVRVDQEVMLRVDHDGAQTRGRIAMVTPFVDEATRSATARVVVDNGDGRWIPGTFVTATITMSEDQLPVVVPRNAVQNIEGRDVVFVEHEGAFEMTPVTTGRADRASVEITAGLPEGTPYVAEGASHLKAAVVTSALGSHAGHGH